MITGVTPTLDLPTLAYETVATLSAIRPGASLPREVLIRPMSRAEVDILVEWAACEGWNPGLQDAECFWAADPEAYIAAEWAGELIGGGAITAYGDVFGFMGFFIVRPEYRGHGLGGQLWQAMRSRLLARLRPGASIGLDAARALQDYYARGGFEFAHRNIRIRLDPPYRESSSETAIVPLTEVPFEAVLEYDRACFPAPRPAFLSRWIHQTEALALGWRDAAGNLRGYGVIRRCREGCRIGPLFADEGQVAVGLLRRNGSDPYDLTACISGKEGSANPFRAAAMTEPRKSKTTAPRRRQVSITLASSA